MDRVDHLMFAAAGQVLISVQMQHGPVVTAVSVVAAGLSSWGPDVDQLSPWRAVDRLVPDEWLGAGGPMRHRGISHWWGWAALAAWWMLSADLGDASFLVWALWWGWVSHLVGDFLFGIKPRGVPVFPWWGHVGIGLRSGGLVERFVVPLMLLASVGLAVWSV